MDFLGIKNEIKIKKLDLYRKSNVRIDLGVERGDEVSSHYDPMIAKLITNGETRGEAIKHMRWAIDEYYVRGIANNLGFLAAMTANSRFQAGKLSTILLRKSLERVSFRKNRNTKISK